MAKTLTVYKYELAITDDQEIEMPQGAELLYVAMQYGKLQLWARVFPDSRIVRRRFRVAGTGHPDARGRYVGTILGQLVWHVFDRGEVEGEAP